MNQNPKRLTHLKLSVKQLVTGVLLGVVIGVAGYFTALTIFVEREQNDDVVGRTTFKDDGRAQNSIESSRRDEVGRNEGSNLRFEDFLVHVNNWSREELALAIEQTAKIPNSIATVSIKELLVGELARTNPEQAFDKVWSFPSALWYDLLPIVFREWSRLNMDEALTAASNLVGTLQESAIRAILDEQEDFTESKIENLTRTLGLHALTQRLIQESEVQNLMGRPTEAWELMMANNAVDDEYWNVLVEVAKVWKQQDGINVLDHLYSDLYDRNISTFTHVLQAIAEETPAQAFDWVVGTSPDVQSKTAAIVLEAWARQDPIGALDASARLADLGNGYWTRQVITSIWAKKDPRALIQHVPHLPKKNRNIAVSAALASLLPLDPNEALESLQQLRSVPGAVDHNAESTLVSSWTKLDPTSAMEWVKTNKKSGSSEYVLMMREFARTYALIDPERALSVARDEASSSIFNSTYLEIEVLDSLARRGQIDVAIKLLDQVRDEARLSAVQTVAGSLIWNNRIEDVLTLAQEMTEDQQVDYFKSIAFRWMLDSPTSLIDNLPNLPSERVRQELVRETLSLAERYDDYFTAAQIETIRTYLDDENSVDPAN